MQTKIIPCDDYAPDQFDFGDPRTSTAFNVVPRTRTTYSGMPSFGRISTAALASQVLSAFSARDPSGNPGMYAGTTSKLYCGRSGTKPNWSDQSQFAYSTPVGGRWSFTEGSGYVYASNGVDPIQRVQTSSASNFANVGANAPTAAVIAAIQPGYLLCGDINDVTVGIQPQGVRWSALGDFTNFPLVGSAAAIAASSDWQEVKGPHGRLKAIAPDLSSCAAALFFEQAVFRMLFSGDSKIFNIQPVEKLRGTPAPASVIQRGQICYFLSYDGWYSFDGTVALPIGDGKVNRTFFADCDPNYLGNVAGIADPLSGLCFWLYAGTGSSMGVPNRILCYNPDIQRFSLITGFTGTSLFLGRTFGTTLDGIDALGYTLDNLPYSLDSPILAGGQLFLAGFDSSFYFGGFTGPNMAITVDTTETQLTPGRRSRVSAVRPLADGACSAQVGTRQSLSDPVAYSSAVGMNTLGFCPVRSDGRYQRFRLTAPAGNLVNHILGAEVTYAPSGAR
jgi:hypothetical protein